MASLKLSTWADIEILRAQIAAAGTGSVEHAAQRFASAFVSHFESVVLCRVFAVLKYASLPKPEREWAQVFDTERTLLHGDTDVLTLLGTAGRKPAWSHRSASMGHRAIPLLSSAQVSKVPMLASLLRSMGADSPGAARGGSVQTREMLGGTGSAFFVSDARTAVDELGRQIISATEFVQAHGVQTVFGMGGRYADQTLVIAIVFCNETVDRLVADRFASLITSFKLATDSSLRARRLFSVVDDSSPAQ